MYTKYIVQRYEQYGNHLFALLSEIKKNIKRIKLAWIENIFRVCFLLSV